ncbi:unnamed protein product [Symbiodinium sp. CCMP2592]|nr:unnamed protein product [Symbiodinium sp. CCMP2592]
MRLPQSSETAFQAFRLNSLVLLQASSSLGSFSRPASAASRHLRQRNHLRMPSSNCRLWALPARKKLALCGLVCGLDFATHLGQTGAGVVSNAGTELPVPSKHLAVD